MEYDLNNPKTWVVRPAPPCDPSFDRELLAIGGTNPFGEPMLVRRWGATYRSKGSLVYQIYEGEEEFACHEFRDPETNELRRAKTTAEIPASVLISWPIYEAVQLGELRWIIEIWKSPDDLAKMGYFDAELQTATHSAKDIDPQLRREARQEFIAMVKAGEKPERALTQIENQLDRARPLDIDHDTKNYFEPEQRVRGDYHFFFRLERENGLYHPADEEALEAIRMIWNYNQTVTPAEHDAKMAELAETGRQRKRERINALWHPDNLTGASNMALA